MAVPLHNHSHYSALDGLSKPEDIALRCKELDFHSCAITDHDVVAGHVNFYKTMKENGIKPILGIETYQTPGNRQSNFGMRKDENGWKADNFHLILLAMNDTGLRNLWTLNSESHKTGFYYNARLDWDLLSKYNEGLICTSACGLSLFNQAIQGNTRLDDPNYYLDRYLSIFGDRFYIELTTYSGEWAENYNSQAAWFAKQRGIPMVYANDAHYAFPDQYDLHETVLCMQYREKLSQRTEPHHTHDLYIMSEDEVYQRLAKYLGDSVATEAIESSETIAAQCSVNLPEYKQHNPVFIPDTKYKNSKDMLFELAVEGYEKKIAKFGLPDDKYLPRFQSEIETIIKADLQDYFLIVRDYIQWAKDHNIMVGPGRGSVGGSLIAFLLGITEIDPIRYDLIFERFYNAGRVGKMPDIDTDFTVAGRSRVKAYISKKYGEPYVAEIGAVSELQGKGAIAKLGTAHDVPIPTVRKINSLITKAIESGQQPSWEKIYEVGGEDIMKYKSANKQLFEDAEALYKHIHTYTVHPSGVLVSDEPLAEVFPLRYHAADKKMVTQWDMRTAEQLGYMKMDILGLRNLDTLDEVNKILKHEGKEQIDYEAVQYMDHPDGLWDLLKNGFTTGVFQIEDGSGAKGLAKEIAPRNVEELGLITALNRPGPLKSGAAKRYIESRKQGKAVRTAISKQQAEACSETWGEFVYQEQVIKFFTLLGYDPKEADEIRDILGKKKRDKMAEAHAEYKKRAYPKMITQFADQAWSEIEQFADYAFNKAHSIAYGIIALYCLYAKYYYPAEFIMAGMKTVDSDDKPRYIQEAQRLGISILPPDIQMSGIETEIENGSIRFGLSDVKGIGKGPAKWIMENRPFTSFEDVIDKAQEIDRKVTLPNGIKRMAINRGQVESLRKLSELTGTELIECEEELLGLSISDNSAKILVDYKDEIERECVPFEAIDDVGEWTIAGIITNVRSAKTKNGKEFAWITLSDGSSDRTLPVWNNTLQRFRFAWRRRNAVVAQVKTDVNGSSLQAAKVLYPKNNGGTNGRSTRKEDEAVAGR